MLENDPAQVRREAIDRCYTRILGQLDWLRGQSGVGEPDLARAVAAVLRNTPVKEVFPEGSRLNVVLRLAVLWGLRGPWLTTEFLLSGVIRLEQVTAGQSTMSDGVKALMVLERERNDHKPTPLHERLRALMGADAANIEDLWSQEAYALRPMISAWQERMRSTDGGKVLDEVSDAVADGVSDRIVEADEDRLARAERVLPAGIFELGYIGNPPLAEVKIAWADVEAVLAQTPDHVGALALRAKLRSLRGDELTEAVSDAERAIALAPMLGSLYVTLARVYQRRGEIPAAIDACTRALAAEEPAPEALPLRAVCNAMIGDDAAAETDARAALARDPNGVAALYALAEVCVYRGDVDGAMAAFEATLAVAPEHPATLLRRAEVLSATGELARALLDADRAVASSDARDAYYNRGTLRMQIEDLDGASADFTAALDRDPTDVQSLLNRGTVQAIRRDMPGALVDWDHAVELAPTHAAARVKRAMGRLHSGALDRAIVDDLQAALRCSAPDWPQRQEVEALLARVVGGLRD